MINVSIVIIIIIIIIITRVFSLVRRILGGGSNTHTHTHTYLPSSVPTLVVDRSADSLHASERRAPLIPGNQLHSFLPLRRRRRRQ